MASVSGALARIKQDLREHLPDESILAACRDAGHRWRTRKLGPVETVHLFVLQVLAFNTAITHLTHLCGRAVNAAAYCRARMRLPLAALQQLLRDSAAALRASLAADSDGKEGAWRWCGLRAWLVDGSSTITPDVPGLQKAFGQPKGQKKGCGFPVPKVLGLFDAFSGLVVEMLCFPLYTHEQSKVWRLHPMLGPLDLLVGDCGFCSYAHLAMLHLRGAAGLFRIHQRLIVDFRPRRKSRKDLPKRRRKGAPTSSFVRRLGKHDQVVRWRRPARHQMSGWMSEAQYDALPAELEVRELRYHIPCRGQRTRCVTIATTLLDPEFYPNEQIARLYGVRWRVETHFAQLKTTLKMRKLKSKTEAGVRKELAAYCLVYNLVHAVMVRAARQQGVTPERISFIDAVRWLLSATPGEAVPKLVVNPLRPGRHEPRVRKDRDRTYPVMTRPRPTLRNALRRQKKRVK
jgi:DDE family transposase